VLLILASVVALVSANSPLAPRYEALLHWRPLPAVNRLELHALVNDGLMAVFFLMVGLELRREMTRGELASMKRLAAPGMAALGGMIVPALIFAAFNWSDAQQMRGWAVPVATDIAFALAVLGMLGARVPIGLKVFLTALAIIDDLGAILVIALFYTGTLDLRALAGAGVLLAALWGLSRLRVASMWPYLLGGLVLWALVFRSGVHATLAGVALAFVVPAGEKEGRDSAADRLEHAIVPVVAFLVLPVFGLTNAGLSFGSLPSEPWTDPVAIGVTLGLLLGKQVGVFGGLVAATRMGLARLPAGSTLTQLYGAAVLCGIGFTMSLFIGELAYRGTPHGDEVKLAVFVGSLLSALLGLLILYLAPRRLQAAAE
jgi:Na+:H+ antiporter, NhaA family